MKAMSIDAEFNQPSRRLIEVGAVIFSPHTGELFDTLHVYVNPEEPLSPEITQLTGITDLDLRDAQDPLYAYMRLKEFHQRHKPAMNPVVWGSSTYSDSSLIHAQAMRYKAEIEPNFMGHRVVDCKTLWQSHAMHRNKGLKCGLDTCVTKKLKIGWDDRFGPPHRALADAWNTARAWHNMTSKLNL